MGKPKKKAVQKPITDIPKKRSYKIEFWVVIIASVVGVIIAIPSIRLIFLSNKKKWDEENTKQGDVKSPKISENTAPLKVKPNFDVDTTSNFPELKGIYVPGLSQRKFLSFQVGNHLFVSPVRALYEGEEIFDQLYKNCSNSTLTLAAKDDRLYVSAKFVDINDETGLIGDMEFNHWTIYNGTYKDYTEGDDKFEVKDKVGHIVFSMAYKEGTDNSFVVVAGYFVSTNSVIVLNNTRNVFSYEVVKGDQVTHSSIPECIPKTVLNWKAKAETEIENIKSAFKKN